MTPRVSVIIPTYNRRDTIGEALRSALGQTAGEVEVIVVDDGSTDGTPDVVRSIQDPRIRFVQAEHGGSVAARNIGFRLATGDYIALLDSDDVWMPQKLARQLAMFEKHPDLAAVVSNVVLFGECLERRMFWAWRHRRLRFREMLAGNTIVFSTLIMKAWVPKELGLLDTSREVLASEDLEYCLRILRHKDGSVLFMKDRLAKFRRRAGSLSHIVSQSTVAEEERFAFIVKKYAGDDPALVRRTVERYRREKRVVRLTLDLYAGRVSLAGFLAAPGAPLLGKAFVLLKYAAKKILGRLPAAEGDR